MHQNLRHVRMHKSGKVAAITPKLNYFLKKTVQNWSLYAIKKKSSTGNFASKYAKKAKSELNGAALRSSAA